MSPLDVYVFLEKQHLLVRVLLIGLVPAVLTCIGVTPIIFGARFGDKFSNTGMGFAAGVMLVASFTSLLLPAMDQSSIWIVIPGFLLGVLLIKLIDASIPHLHFLEADTSRAREDQNEKLRKAWLLLLAIIVHNIPEGMAVGAAASYNVRDGLALAIAIGIQDVPEGLAVALPILAVTNNVAKAVGAGVVSGVVEAIAALLPPLVITWIPLALPLLMALAAGAMIYVVVHEISPDIYTDKRYKEWASAGFITGFIVMLVLDSVF